jgi:hypothetical protein
MNIIKLAEKDMPCIFLVILSFSGSHSKFIFTLMNILHYVLYFVKC